MICCARPCPGRRSSGGPARLLATARILWQFGRTISIINFQSLGVTVTSAVSRSVNAVLVGKRCGFPWAGVPLSTGSSPAAFPSPRADLLVRLPGRTLKAGTRPSPSFECLHGWRWPKGKAAFSARQANTHFCQFLNNTCSFVTDFASQMEVFFPYLTLYKQLVKLSAAC